MHTHHFLLRSLFCTLKAHVIILEFQNAICLYILLLVFAPLDFNQWNLVTQTVSAVVIPISILNLLQVAILQQKWQPRKIHLGLAIIEKSTTVVTSSIASYCTYDYCYPPTHTVNINLNVDNGADAQCNLNHSGLLCGTCKPGLSLSLVSNIHATLPATQGALCVPNNGQDCYSPYFW